VESGHARGGRVDSRGTTMRPILGPVLDGRGFAMIADTDGGRLDGDAIWDRAVGPMQFIPQTWVNWAADGNADNRADPHNVYDASLAAARYLCADGRDLSKQVDLEAAILSYNHSTAYLNFVLAWMRTYADSIVAIPDTESGDLGQDVDPPGDIATQATKPPDTPAGTEYVAAPAQSSTLAEPGPAEVPPPSAIPVHESPPAAVVAADQAPNTTELAADEVTDPLLPLAERPVDEAPCVPLAQLADIPAVLTRPSQSPDWPDTLAQCASDVLDTVSGSVPIGQHPGNLLNALTKH
jgi:hypothetical protein